MFGDVEREAEAFGSIEEIGTVTGSWWGWILCMVL